MIGHSLGGAATLTMFAETREFLPRRICLFGVPSDMDYILKSFAMMLGLKARAMAALRAHFERTFGVGARDISVTAAGPHVHVPVLVVHDEDDNVAPIAQGQMLAAAIPGSRLLLTKGLGHSGGLRDAATIQRVIAFLGEGSDVRS